MCPWRSSKGQRLRCSRRPAERYQTPRKGDTRPCRDCILRRMRLKLRSPWPALCALVALAFVAPRATAEVTRVEVKERAAIGASGYEKIVGIAHFAVDPKDPRNKVIADIDKAPVNAAGKVEFTADLYILRPIDPAKSNGIALVDVVNRGRKTVLTGFNRNAANDVVTEADLGDGFLTRQGYTIVAVGWEFD